MRVQEFAVASFLIVSALQSDDIALFRKAVCRDSSAELRTLLAQHFDITINIREEVSVVPTNRAVRC